MNEMRPWRRKTDKHLCDLTSDELLTILCQDCKKNNMAEYACRDEYKSNVPLCIDCCHCPEHDECEPCEYWVEV